jgi:O-antigen/teichoic acid export membrane protein
MREQKAFVGTIAMSAVSVAKLGLQLLVLPILARILGPESFGLVGLAWPFIVFASVLSDAGLGTALVRESNPTPQLEATMFWLSTAVGVISALLLVAVAWPLAAAFSRPDLAPVLAALAPILAIGGSMTVPTARITRSRHFTIFAIGEVLAVSLSVCAALIAAAWGLGVWSLVIQQLVIWTTKLFWLFPKSGFTLSFYCKPSLARHFLGFGLNSAAAQLADLSSKYLPPLVVGAVFGVTELGHYSMAYQLTRVPEMVISGPIYLAAFTAVAQARNEGAARELVFKSLRLLSVSLIFVFCTLSLTSDLIVDVLFGAKWADTGPVLAALAPAGFFVCIYSFLAAVLLGRGNSAQQFAVTALCGLAMFIGAVVGSNFGTVGIATGVSLGAGVLALPYLRAVARQLHTGIGSLAAPFVTPIIAGCVMVLTVVTVRMEISALPLLVQLVVTSTVALLSFVPIVALLEGRTFLDDLKSFRPSAGEVRSPRDAAVEPVQLNTTN